MFAGVRGASAHVALSAALLAAIATGVVSGCNSSDSAGPVADASTEGYVTVVTAGGGDASNGDPFSGSSSGGVADTGASSSGSGGGSSSGPDAGTDGSTDGAPVDDVVFSDAPYDAPSCNGTDPCDLRSNTCCLTNVQPSATNPSGIAGTCTAGRTASCCPPSGNCMEATVHCGTASDCPLGLSCCGDIIVLLGQVEAKCRNVPQGGNCPYVPSTNSQIGVQLCKTDAECTNGQPCVRQTCAYGAMLSMCGVQNYDPLNCTATP